MATKAASQRTQIGLIKESAFGVTPNTPQLTEQRHSDSSFTLTIEQLQDDTKTALRQYLDVSQGNRAVTGTINGPLCHANYDTLLECAMLNTWSNNSLALGNDRVSLTVEEAQSDISQYFVYKGFVGNSFSIDAPNNGNVTIAIEGMAMEEEVNSASISTSTYTPFASKTPFTHCNGTITEGGVPIAYVSGINFSLNNNYTSQNVWGDCETSDLIEGRAQITGTFTVFFVNALLYNKFVNGTSSSLEVTFSDGTNSLTFSMPKIKYVSGEKPSGNTNDPRTISLGFEAFAPTSNGSALTITRTAI